MIQILGGDTQSRIYLEFQNLVIKAFLACRPYSKEIITMVSLMLDSGLACFKGEGTLKRLESRFQLELSVGEAAAFMKERITESFENLRTVLYDGFQKMTNGIPY